MQPTQPFSTVFRPFAPTSRAASRRAVHQKAPRLIDSSFLRTMSRTSPLLPLSNFTLQLCSLAMFLSRVMIRLPIVINPS